MTYILGSKSIAHLDGVHPSLVSVVKLAIGMTTQDFTVMEGMRTLAQQREYIRRGTSKTMHSMHLMQKDGFAHAVDLVPWIGGNPVWDWDGCAKIAHAMDRAATKMCCADRIIWGGAWDRRLSDFGAGTIDRPGDLAAYMNEVSLYKKRHPGPDFIDGPHFEWR